MANEFGEGTKGQVVGHIEKNENERVRVSVQLFKGHPGIDIRILDKKGKNWCWSDKGVRLPLKLLEELCNLLGEARLAAEMVLKMQDLRNSNYRYRGSGKANPRSKGTNPRSIGTAPRQIDAADPFDDNTIDVSDRIEAKNAPQKGEEAA